jgi:hypothetical protein
MVFSSCVNQVEHVNPRVQLSFKGIHPLHSVIDGKLLDYDNDSPPVWTLTTQNWKPFIHMLQF